MSVPCKGWCGLSAPSESQEKCSACMALELPFLALHPEQIPTLEERRVASGFIEPTRGLSSEQMTLGLAERFNENSLPDGFKASRGGVGNLSQHISERWEHALLGMSMSGRVPMGSYPIPHFGDLSHLNVAPDGKMDIDGIKMEGPLPLADICEWLSNAERVGSVRSWKELLLAMSNCCLSMPLNIPPESWPHHLFSQGWDGIDAPSNSITMEFPGAKLHPFLHTIAMISGRESSLNRSPGYIARTSPSVISRFGGEASSEWQRIISRADEKEFQRLHRLTIHPRLVVDESLRMRMIVLRSGTPTTVPVSVNAKVWRCLIHSLMFPEGSDGANFAKHLFWVWESMGSEWTPSPPQIKSSRMLREAIESLGASSSLEAAITKSREYSGIWVTGTSGLAYHIQGFPSSGVKFYVTAYPSKEHISKPGCQGITICIDSQKVGGIDLPAGDICASYVLALRHDTTSRNSIFTVEHLLHICEFTNENFVFEDDLDAWWECVSSNFEMFEEGHMFEEPEPEPEIWQEGPPPPDMLEEPPPEVFEELPPDLFEEPQYEPPQETTLRWSGSTIQEMLENRRNFPDGMDVE